MSEYPVVTICGSMRYYQQMVKAAEHLTGNGYIVLMPFVAAYSHGEPSDARKKMLDDMHKKKIDMSETIMIIGTHRGESTVSEIQYAVSLGKAIMTWE
jgi:hypothetical protein